VLGIMHVMRIVRAICHELLGHASNIHTRAAQSSKPSLLPVAAARALNQRHLGTMPRRNARRAHATTATTNAQVVVVIIVVAFHGSVDNTTCGAGGIKFVAATPQRLTLGKGRAAHPPKHRAQNSRGLEGARRSQHGC